MAPAASRPRIVLTGCDLTIEQVVMVARRAATVEFSPPALELVRASRKRLEDAVQRCRDGQADEIYGVTTGFGNFKNHAIAPADQAAHQRNLIRSHSTGAGLNHDRDDPVNSFPARVVRATLLLRINTLLRGHSGMRVELLDRLKSFLDADILPEIPLRGSVGASGDLCPLSHLALGLIGEGRGRSGTDSTLRPIAELLATAELPPRFELEAKEGLALINGTAVTTAVGALAVARAEILAESADSACSLTHEAMCGRLRALDERVHQARAHPGQIQSAARLRAALGSSRLANRAIDRQDPYSLRCAPQVHGASRDAIAYAERVVEIELNSTNDNPLILDEGVPSVDADSLYPERGPAHSAGNFHAQPIALAMDFLAIAVAELASIAERRVQMLLDPHHNRGLPANLAANAGLNSGLLLVQYLAAALVSENKVLTHPASVDSVPTAAGAEDHVSMGTHAARKCHDVLDNVECVLAVEFLTAAQALDWRLMALAQSPQGRPPALVGAVASLGPQADLAALGVGSRSIYKSVRAASPFVDADRPLDADIALLRSCIAAGTMTLEGAALDGALSAK